MVRRQKLATRTGGHCRGAAAVEFAVLLPLFLMLALGTWEMGSALTAGTKMSAAIREGGRLASMDYKDTLKPGQTINQKVVQDIQSFLTASDIPGNKVTITITHTDGPSAGQNFDLSNQANYLQMFTIKAQINYSDISTFPVNYMKGQKVEAKLAFRLGRNALN